MDLTEQLRVLDAAQGDPAKLALATVDLAYPELHEAERATLKKTLEAAAIPHWCDEAILAALLEISPEDSAARLARLAKLTVLEPFRARGENALNVHEATRLALRKAMAAEQLESFRTLSRRMVAFFASDPTPRGQIEWIYHLLCDDPDRGATELIKISHDWSRTANTKDAYALSSVLEELEKTGLVMDRARVWTHLTISWTRVGQGEAAQLENVATETLQLSREVGDQLAEADAHCLVGVVLQAQGKLSDALAAFARFQTISGKLAEEDPLNNDRYADLGVALNRLGGVLEAQGKLVEAQEAFGESLEISRILVEREPSNVSRHRDLLAAYSRVGAVLGAQGKLTEALAAFGQHLSISQQLVDQKPDNASWKQLLAVAHASIGDILLAQGKVEEAHEAYRQFVSISQQLADLEPTNALFQFNLAASHGRMGDLFWNQGKLAEALEAFGKLLSIGQQGVNQDPTNSEYQKHLASAYERVGAILRFQNKFEEAQEAFGASLSIGKMLAEQDSTNAGWQQFLASSHACMGEILQAQGKLPEAREEFGASLSISRQFAEQDSTNAEWWMILASTLSQIGYLLEAQDELPEAREAFAESLSISQRLVDRDPTNRDWQQTLVLACIKVARFDFEAKKYHEALPFYEEVLRIMGTWPPDTWAEIKTAVEAELSECRLLASGGQPSNSESAGSTE